MQLYLDRFSKSVSVSFAEANTSPLKHLSFLDEVRHSERLLLDEFLLVLSLSQIIDFIQEVAGLLDPAVTLNLIGRLGASSSVNLEVALGVLKRQVGALNER